MRELTEHENFKVALEAMSSIDPVKSPARAEVTPHGAHIMLGEQTGWAQYESMFLALATRLPISQAMPEADYKEQPEPEHEES